MDVGRPEAAVPGTPISIGPTAENQNLFATVSSELVRLIELTVRRKRRKSFVSMEILAGIAENICRYTHEDKW